MISLDKVLGEPDVRDLWDRGTVILRLDDEVVFRIQHNYHVSVDKIQLLDAEQEEFTDAIRKYNVINMQTLADQLTIDIIKKENNNMDKHLQDAISFLQGEADQLREFKDDEVAFENYVAGNVDPEDYEVGGYDLYNYLENTFEFIYDQISNARGYDYKFANYILDIIDAYYAGGSAYVENDIEAECGLLVEALEYVIIKLKGGLK